jgi:hypothetical protein
VHGPGLNVNGFEVAPDGQRFLTTVRAPDAETGRVVLVQNWLAELRKSPRLPTV